MDISQVSKAKLGTRQFLGVGAAKTPQRVQAPKKKTFWALGVTGLRHFSYVHIFAMHTLILIGIRSSFKYACYVSWKLRCICIICKYCWQSWARNIFFCSQQWQSVNGGQKTHESLSSLRMNMKLPKRIYRQWHIVATVVSSAQLGREVVQSKRKKLGKK